MKAILLLILYQYPKTRSVDGSSSHDADFSLMKVYMLEEISSWKKKRYKLWFPCCQEARFNCFELYNVNYVHDDINKQVTN